MNLDVCMYGSALFSGCRTICAYVLVSLPGVRHCRTGWLSIFAFGSVSAFSSPSALALSMIYRKVAVLIQSTVCYFSRVHDRLGFTVYITSRLVHVVVAVSVDLFRCDCTRSTKDILHWFLWDS